MLHWGSLHSFDEGFLYVFIDDLVELLHLFLLPPFLFFYLISICFYSNLLFTIFAFSSKTKFIHFWFTLYPWYHKIINLSINHFKNYQIVPLQFITKSHNLWQNHKNHSITIYHFQIKSPFTHFHSANADSQWIPWFSAHLCFPNPAPTKSSNVHAQSCSVSCRSCREA